MNRLVAYFLVAAQFAISAVLVFGAQLRPACFGCFAVALTGAVVAVWAWLAMGLRRLRIMPHVHRDARLVTVAPYRWIRHPMYSGLLLFCAGLLLSNPSTWKAVLWLALLATLEAKSRIEEKLLAQRFPAYAEYTQRTWRYVPYLY
ncbi:MAG: isoprenylcysteine carboxylmethyltransferase family protein [Planctomycetales bacterium]|nr:isoprenylcysteine carboxylmethyltransferase family protein [Planctomycetales bacterium]